MGQLRCAGLVGHVRLHLQHLEEPVEPGAAFLVEPREIHEPADRVDQHSDAHQEGQQVGEVERPPRDARCAKHDHGNGDELREGGHSAREPCFAPIADTPAREKPIVLIVEARSLERLVGEGFNHSYTRERIFDARVDIADAVFAQSERGNHAPAEMQREEEHHRQEAQHDQRERPVDTCEDD